MRIIRRILSGLFPRPRGPVTWQDAAPLAVFLLLYAVLCVVLEWRHVLLFSYPTAFVLMAVTPWVWWLQICGGTGLSRRRQVAAFLTRLSLIGVFVMLLAEPRAVRTHEELSVIYCLDISDSIGDSSRNDIVAEALTHIAEANGPEKKPEKDEVGLVLFGRNAAVELPPRPQYQFEAINVRIDRDATNLENALSLAAAMLPDETQGRIVLVSDGTATEGDLRQVLDELKSRGITVDVLPISYNLTKEVWLERLELPSMVKIGENYQATVIRLHQRNDRLVLNHAPLERLRLFDKDRRQLIRIVREIVPAARHLRDRTHLRYLRPAMREDRHHRHAHLLVDKLLDQRRRWRSRVAIGNDDHVPSGSIRLQQTFEPQFHRAGKAGHVPNRCRVDLRDQFVVIGRRCHFK